MLDVSQSTDKKSQQISLSEEMTFLTMTLAVALGSILGNLSLIYILGRIAVYGEYKKNKQIIEQYQKVQTKLAEAIVKENDRMAKYAKLEGYSN